MSALTQHPRAVPHMPAVARILSRFDRRQLEGFIAVAIDLADALDAPNDPDEPNFASHSDGLPGDANDIEPDDDREPGAYAEWSNLSTSRRRASSCIVDTCGHEDDEEDDPQGQCDEDGINTSHGGLKCYAGPGCAISDPGGDPFDDREPDESPYTASYGIDQSNALPSLAGRDINVDFDCGDAVKCATAGLLPRG